MSANEKNEADESDRNATNIKSDDRTGSSMTSLIIWNITKALNNNPSLDLKSALSTARMRMESNSDDVSSTISQHPDDRNLVCALLAWQQLGHKHTSSLYSFLESTWKNLLTEQPGNSKASDKCKDCEDNTGFKMPHQQQIRDYISYRESVYSNSIYSSSFATNRMGPVVKLPVEEKVVMHLQNTSCNPTRLLNSGRKPNTKDIMEKIDAACCVESACQEKLSRVEAGTKELRERAVRLAKREAERVELLERAEAAWRELENGYQRRLKRSEDQGEDLLKQIQKLVEERKSYRSTCSSLAQKLKCRGANAEAERERLAGLERQVYEHACARHRLAEEAARADSVLSDYQCKVAQLDRDLQFKEEQARCKKLTQSSELECARALTYEAERVMHAELASLKEHLAQASAEAVRLDAGNKAVMEKIEELKLEKNDLLEGLETCQEKCEGEIKDKIDALNLKRQELGNLKEKVLECRCKAPVEAAVEVRRTPSLAALCCCEPEDRFMDSCSCTSLRSKLMTDLLADLFSGLQSELGNCSAEMPCQLVKCLEDKHSWDRTSPVKTNIEKFFAKLLIGELDIAITTSIEKYHAKWVGLSCADACRAPNDPCDEEPGWQERAIERRAQKLAVKLADQLCQQRADQLTSKAKEIVKSNPPCDCSGPSNAVYQCFTKPKSTGGGGPFATQGVGSANQPSSLATTSWRRTNQTVAHLKEQIDNLQMETLKKQDLRKMEQNITKLLQRANLPEKDIEETAAIERKGPKTLSRQEHNNKIGRNFDFNSKSSNFKRKTLDNTNSKKTNVTTSAKESQLDKLKFNKPSSYAINLCLCSPQKTLSKSINQSKSPVRNESNSHAMPALASLRTIESLQKNENKESSKTSALQTCPDKCVCFHKMPSSTSIDKLLETLNKWKNELNNSSDGVQNEPVQKEVLRKNSVTFSDVAETDKNIKKCQNKTCKINSKASFEKFTNNSKAELLSPDAKDSEYLATVNFEKSIEMCCKCKDILDDVNNSSISLLKNNVNSSNLSKSITPDTKEMREDLVNENCADRKQNRRMSSFLGDNKSEVILNRRSIKDISKSSIQDDCECEYNIKFLGVTVTNDEEYKSSKLHISNNDEAHADRCGCRTNVKQSFEKCPGSINNSLGSKKNSIRDDRTASKSKVLVTQSFNVQVNSNPILNKMGANSEIHSEYDYKNLEDNTFELLREHLTEKMEEYNKHFNYSGFPKEEEGKLCSSILQKIKQFISESTSTTHFCQCPVNSKTSDGTWNRAYSLLQEYLKSKLKRVQCICIPKNSQEYDKSTLPDLLKTICDMIDTDFQKLSKIYSLQDNKGCIKEKAQEVFEIPEKDTNTIFKLSEITNDKYTSQTVCEKVSECCVFKPETFSRQISSNLIPLTNHMSSQVPYLLGMESKYCTTVCDTDFKNMQSEIKLQNDSCMCDCDFHNELLPDHQIICNFSQSKTINNKTEAINTNIMNNSEYSELEHLKTAKNTTPYIGLTVECSCVGKLDSCICSKALAAENDKIKNIWNDVAKFKINVNDMSYIMKKSLGKVNSDTQILPKKSCFDTNTNASADTKNFCNVEILTCYDDEIVLKKSFESGIYKTDETTKTLVKDVYNEVPNLNSLIKYEKVNFNIKHQDVLSKPKQCVRLCKSEFLPKWDSKHSIDVGKMFGRLCDCSMVPICHVKMLMESIENKLAHSKCTCDSLLSNVCPVHSKLNC